MIVLLLLLHITEALVQQNQHPIIMNGDIIFVQPPLNKESAFGKAIEKTGDATIRWWNERRINKTQSNDTAIHAAVYVGNDTIVEAVPDFGVRTNNVSVFFEEYPPNTIFYFGRVSPPLQSSLRSVLLSEIGKPYANDFDSPPQSFYCSSLVTYAYKKALIVPSHQNRQLGPDGARIIIIIIKNTIMNNNALGYYSQSSSSSDKITDVDVLLLPSSDIKLLFPTRRRLRRGGVATELKVYFFPDNRLFRKSDTP